MLVHLFAVRQSEVVIIWSGNGWCDDMMLKIFCYFSSGWIGQTHVMRDGCGWMNMMCDATHVWLC